MAGAPTSESIVSQPQERPWLTVAAICRELGVGRAWVKRQLRRSSYQPQDLPIPGFADRQEPHYSSECQVWLKQELAKVLACPPLGRHYTLLRAATELGCTRAAVRSDLKRYGLPESSKRRRPDNRLVDSIAWSTFHQLRNIRRRLLAPNDVATAHELGGLTGWHPETVAHRLRHMLTRPYLAGDGQVRDHYPIAEAIQTLGLRPDRDVSPAGDWQTAHRMATRLGRSWRWIVTRLDTLRFRQARRLLLDDSSLPRWHYPPWVFKALQALSESETTQLLVA